MGSQGVPVKNRLRSPVLNFDGMFRITTMGKGALHAILESRKPSTNDTRFLSWIFTKFFLFLMGLMVLS